MTNKRKSAAGGRTSRPHCSASRQWLNIQLTIRCLCGKAETMQAGSEVLDNAVETVRNFVHFHKGHKRPTTA